MDGEDLVSVFHLRNFRRKNLGNLAKAVALVATQEPDVRLSVVGGGDVRDVARCRRLTDKVAQISLAGPMGRDQVRRRLNAAAGFVLPSRGETFGLVFVEALFAGTPVIYPRGRAIDGYFDGLPFAIAVDAKDPHSIAAALREVHRNQNALKEALGEWQGSDHANKYRRPAIGAAFADGLTRAMVVAA
jgi:glycosyltransferase involved in cell wall biosynthesis